MLPVLLAALVGLASCSKSVDGPKPAAAQLAGTWSLDAERYVTTPTNGGATTTTDNKYITPGETKVTYSTNGTYEVTTKGAANGSGTYTFSGNTIAFTSGGKTATRTVPEFTNNRLVLVQTVDDASYHTTITDTYNR